MGSSFLTHSAAAIIFTAATLPAFAWSPGTGNESATVGFSVDTQSRNDVISFWHCVYMESENFQTKSILSADFRNDVQRRVNYYRAMAGLSASIDLTSSSPILIANNTPANARPSPATTKQAAALAAATMLSANSSEFIAPNGGIANGTQDPHNPPNTWSSDGSIARNGAFHSNLAIGLYGPDAIDAYISEDADAAAGAENDEVGHRRLIFQSRLQELATGDALGSGDTTNGGTFDANALYVTGNLLTTAPAQFVPWPNAGYIPETITPERWSLSYPGADFSSARVIVTDTNGSDLPVTIQSTSANFGEETIIWEFDEGQPSAAIADQVYNVSVSDIGINGSAMTHSYQVTIINPDRLSESTDLTGSISPPDSGANYFFNAVDHAEEYELDVSALVNATWNEGAETSEINTNPETITDNTDMTYELRSSFSSNGSQFRSNGDSAFRLAFPRNEFDPFQSFVINRTLIPRIGGSIAFQLRRGLMAVNTRLSIQSSLNGGITWMELAHFTGNNTSQGGSFADSAFTSQNILVPSTGQNTLIRFVLEQPINTGVFNIADFPSDPIGVFIDEIRPLNCDVLESLPSTTYSASASSVPLDSTTGGGALVAGDSYTLRLRVRVGCEWFPFGESLEVTPVAASSLSAYELWLRGQFAIIGSFTDDHDQDGIPNGAERIFGLNPLDASDASSALTPEISGGNLQLTHAVLPGETITAEYSSTLLPGSWSPATVSISNGIATASVPVTHADSCFLRWVIAP